MKNFRDQIIIKIDAALTAGSGKEADLGSVMNYNAVGIKNLYNPELALSYFLLALEFAGNDQYAQAACLINIGDLVRRMKDGSPVIALEIFKQANQKEMTSVTRSRLYNMQGMAYFSLAVEKNEDGDLIVVDRDQFDLYKDSMEKSQDFAYKSIDQGHEEEGEKAVIFALRRHLGNMIILANQDEREKLLSAVDRALMAIYPNEYHDDWFKFLYLKAMLLRHNNPEQAAQMLVVSAIALPNSPADAGPYYLLAAEIYIKVKEWEWAFYCYQKYMRMKKAVESHSDWTTGYLKLEKKVYDCLKQENKLK